MSVNKSVLGDKRFFAANGAVYSNLQELAVGLKYMDLKTFSHHATLEKNDFASWARDLFDEKLGAALLSCKNPHQMANQIGKKMR